MTKRKKYTSEFKREAVRLMESSEKPSSEVARQLGVRRNQLYKWKEQLGKRGAKAFPGGPGRRVEAGDEVARLKRELEQGQRGARHSKKGSSVLCQGARVKYGFMRAHQDQFKVSRMCEVSRSVAVAITAGGIERSPSVSRRIEPYWARSKRCTSKTERPTGQ